MTMYSPLLTRCVCVCVLKKKKFKPKFRENSFRIKIGFCFCDFPYKLNSLDFCYYFFMN